MQVILERIAIAPQRVKPREDAQTDQLRRMAEAVNEQLRQEEMIQSVGYAMDASADTPYLGPATFDGSLRSAALSSNGNAAARSPAYAAQMQAYRENA